MKKMMRLYGCALLVLLAAACSSSDEEPQPTPPPGVPESPIQGAALVSGQPIPALANEGVAPLNLTKTSANAVLGTAYLSSQSYPDLFVSGTYGLAAADGGQRGVNLCEFRGKTADGALIYGAPIAIKNYPWEWDERMVRVLQIDGKVYGFFLSSTRFRVAEYDAATRSFGDAWVSNEQLTGIPYGVLAFDVMVGATSVDVVFLMANVANHKPTMDDVTESYYDSMGIYRGLLPYAGVYTMSFNRSDWQLKTAAQRLSTTEKSILAGQGIAHIATEAVNGYVLGNKFGTFKWQPAGKQQVVDYLYTPTAEVLTNNNVMANLCPIAADEDKVVDDFISSGEGMLYLYRFTGEVTADGTPIYQSGQPILQQQANIYPGSLSVPTVVDWDGDGALDIISGNSEGRMLFFKNYGTTAAPAFGDYSYLSSDGEPICFRAGYYEVQGPLEAGWGYTCPNVVDWNGDGLLDVVFSTNEGKFEYMLNEGTATEPQLGRRHSMLLDGLELYGVWRCRPAVAEINGRVCIAIMDDEDALHLYEKRADNAVVDRGQLLLFNGNKITGYRANTNESLGERGREKLEFVDWDGDGDLDLVVGTPGQSSFPTPELGLPWSRSSGMQVLWLENVGNNSDMGFAYPRQFTFRGRDYRLGWHANAAAVCMMGDTSHGPNLLVGCESGNFYFFNHYDLTTVTLW
ncbi:MAG: VCBS repeat-containing protein [Alistipes sp.]|nr:VCBS repeat-containing protein [Alistipes sp.]